MVSAMERRLACRDPGDLVAGEPRLDPNKTYILHRVTRVMDFQNNRPVQPRFQVTTICVPGREDLDSSLSTVEVQNQDLINLYDELF